MSEVSENNKRDENNMATTEQENFHEEGAADHRSEETPPEGERPEENPAVEAGAEEHRSSEHGMGEVRAEGSSSSENDPAGEEHPGVEHPGVEHPEEEQQEEGHHEEEGHIDYSHYSKKELVKEIEQQLKSEKVQQADSVAQELKSYFDELEEADRQAALDKFTSGGGEEADFEYRHDEPSDRFYEAYRQIKERKSQFYENQNRSRTQNLAAKQQLLEKLRDLVDNEETQISIHTLKELQKEWRSIGQVPPQYARNLWGNYNALINRFYDNRSIYFELKELDRKKNLEAKQELCEKAENLAEAEDIREAIRQLDELHEEYKHIGPVPKEEQEPLWQRFKAASDKIHDRRRENVETFKKELQENMEAKLKLCEAVIPFVEFQSESIKEWNQKTKEIQQLQKKWEHIGSMPRDQAKEINKKFWSHFKQFFAHKGEFFKSLDEKREENLKKKEELVAKAESLKDSEDWHKTSNELKRLQQEWKNIGPVPEKVREEIYQRFKSACDHFFERRRSQSKAVDSEYENNLNAKKQVCDQIEKMAGESNPDPEEFLDLSEQFGEIGFVPKGAIKSISQRFNTVVNTFLSQAENLDDQQKQELKIEAEVLALRNSPGAERKMNNREVHLKKKISRLEEDISLWKNNITFFASSRKADKLKEEFEEKIEKATAELGELKSQLDIIQNIR